MAAMSARFNKCWSATGCVNGEGNTEAMLKNEAQWLSARLATLTLDEGPLLNVGASSAVFRETIQPWIDAQVFAPLRARGLPVIHQDLQDEPGIDISGSLYDAACQDLIRRHEVRSILCSNVLEHVADPAQFAQILYSLLPPGGRLIVTVPHSFPYHPDPIDTLFRPTTRELIALFPELEVVQAQLVRCGRLHNLVTENPGQLLSKLTGRSIKRAQPNQATPLLSWLIPWTFSPFQVTCVDLVKREPTKDTPRA